MGILKLLAILLMPGLLLMTSCNKEEEMLKDSPILKAGNKGELNLNGPHFELNLVAKKDNWNENEFDNPDRHTIFIPRNTEGWNIILNQPNNLELPSLPGVRIDMSQGPEFAVLDGSVFDGDKAEFQLGPGKYQVFVAMRGKKNVDPATLVKPGDLPFDPALGTGKRLLHQGSLFL
jgi:hypothetical protein